MIYLDNAATTWPKPPMVYEVVYGAMKNIGANPGRAGHDPSIRAGRAVLRAREKVAEILGIDDPANIIFCFNCTDALNLAIKGILLPGDHAVMTSLEHNSVLRPLRELERAGIISLSVIEPEKSGFVDAGKYMSAVNARTKLCVMTHVSNVTGAIQPIMEVGAALQARNSHFLVDAAQSLGVLPVNVYDLHADMIAFPGHKGLMGPHGTGGLYIRPGLVLKTLKEGGTGTSSEKQYQPEELPERYESGTVNFPGLAGLFAGAYYANKHRREIYEHEAFLAKRMRDGLLNIQNVIVYTPPKNALGVISFNVGSLDSGLVAEALNDHSVCVRSGLHCAPGTHNFLGTLTRGAVRASVGAFNTKEDVDALLLVINALMK